MRPIIRVTVEGGMVQAVEHFKGNGNDANEDAIVMVWDFDCEGNGGSHENAEGEEFNLDAWTPMIIEEKDLFCKEIIREEEEENPAE